jgi:DNA-directed RNA polymerase subunit beta'
MNQLENIKSITIRIASPEEILEQSFGEVTKPETINYRTLRPERDGLFCEKIFGPTKNYQCYCGKYRGMRYKGVICDRCGVEVTHSFVRRERMGHIKLATPVAHIWFWRVVPSRIGLLLDLSIQQLERIIYHAGYLIKKVDEEKKKKLLEQLEAEFKEKVAKDSSKKEELEKLKKEVEEEILKIKKMRVLSEIEYSYLSEKYGDIFEVGSGAEVLDEMLKEIDFEKEIEKLKNELKEAGEEKRKKILLKLRFLRSMQKAGIRPEWMILKVLPVLPPDLRPIVQLVGGRFASSDLNDLYRRVINRNNRLKYLLEIGAPEVIIKNEKRMLQEAVDALIDNGIRKKITARATTGGKRLLKSLADILEGKQGRFRQNLLGKRVDYSGRSVIVAGPELRMDEVGIPKKMMLEIFKPFVVGYLLQKEIVYNVREALRLIDEETDEVWEALEQVVKDKYVLINRAPTLHRLNIQACKPKLIEGLAIRIHPLICKAFNADFDGDQMAVFLPLSEEAQKEAREIMRSSLNILTPANGFPLLTLSQDIILGIYWLTDIVEGKKGEGKVFSSIEEAILAYENKKIDLRAKIKVFTQRWGFLETSLGRIIFNSLFPEDFEFQQKQIKLADLEEIVSKLLEKYDREKVCQILDEIKWLGFEYSTISGISLALSDFKIPSQKPNILKEAYEEIEKIEKDYESGLLSLEEKKSRVIECWMKAKAKIEKLVPETLTKMNPIYQMVDSKARGSWLQPIQMCGMKGLVINPAGEIIEIPVKSCYREGFSVLEYFISTHGARKGVADKALNTAVAGYLTRRLVDVAHGVIVTKEDCGDEEGVVFYKKDAQAIGLDFAMRIFGRISLTNIPKIVKKGEMIDYEKAKKIASDPKIESIRVRSPFSCKLNFGVCQKCYGMDLARRDLVKLGEAVGVIAAQSIGEPGTQLTLRAFHVGGVVGAGYMVTGLPRLNEIFEARTPEAKGIISPYKGKVVEISEGKIKIKVGKKIEEFQFLPGRKILVKEGDKVKEGDILVEGPLDPKELFKYKGKFEVFRYLLNEIQKNYFSQGAKIHDKHMEIILRMMFSKVKIVEPGDSDFLPGEIVDKYVLEKKMREEKWKNPPQVKEILLGISSVALNTPSFLSAASFQETARVLIEAAIQGKEDELLGLKENVIVGLKVPVGTGFRYHEES